MKKVLRIYREHRDFMCAQLTEKLGDVIDFKIPEGGLSIWTKFNKKYPLPRIAEKLLQNNIALSPGMLHDITSGRKLNSTRLGFGWMNIDEAEKAINLLVKVIRK